VGRHPGVPAGRAVRGVGGYPLLIEHSRSLVLPENPHAYENGDEYTNLEKWIFAMDNAVYDTSPPMVVASLSARPVSASQARLIWPAASDDTGILGYRIFRNYLEVARTSGTSFADTGLEPGT